MTRRRMPRLRALIARLVRREPVPLPPDPFGPPGGPVESLRTPDSVGWSAVPTNTMRAG